MYFPKENHLCRKMEHPAHSFPVRIEFVLESNTSWNLAVPRWR
jgi:hypothetical protein